ncbi:MAG: hypothetical protein RLY31_485 [Bacteroidota bacterium]
MEKATFGAGCFWCVEAVFQGLRGVHRVLSGYAGGKVAHPTYREVCSGLTGHAEVVEIQFDPEVISYETLVRIFFTTHDPTTLNRQGADRGTQYRSVIFHHDERQRETAVRMKEHFAPTLWHAPIVTEISPAQVFYEAEAYHQEYYRLNPDASYCRIVIDPKVAKMRATFGSLLGDGVPGGHG